MVVSTGEIVVVVAGSIVLSLAILYATWPWARRLWRLVTVAIAMLIGIVLWNVTLNVTGATQMNVNSSLRVSAQDAGSGILAFATTALALGLLERDEAAGRVVGAAGIAGIVTMLVDLFA